MAGFDNPWYADIIERFAPSTGHKPNSNHAVDGHAQALLAAACVIAAAIDDLAEAIGRATGTGAEDRDIGGEG